MSFGYLAATDPPATAADRATLWTFVPSSRTELVTGALAGLYAWFRWRNGWYAGLAGAAGAKLPILTAAVLVLEGMQATRRRFAEG